MAVGLSHQPLPSLSSGFYHAILLNIVEQNLLCICLCLALYKMHQLREQSLSLTLIPCIDGYARVLKKMY